MRLIDADDLKVRIEMERPLTLDNQFLPTLATFEARYIIDHMPTIDAAPVKHGYWTNARTMEHDGEWYCSVCGYEPTFFENTLYCSNCGAKMDGERRENE